MTTTTAVPLPHRRPVQRRRLHLASAAVIALLAGLAIGFFVTYEPATSAVAASPVARSSADRMAELERRVAANPDDVGGWQALGTTAVQRAAETGDPAFYAVAANAFDRADDVDPGAGQTLLGRGALALSLHDFDRALTIGRQAVAALPANADALGVLVDAQVELGAYDDAALTLQQMLDVRPDLPALARTSYLRELTGDLEGARQAMRQARSAGAGAPADVASVATLQGDLALAAGDVPAARTLYAEALELVPGLALAEVGAARVQAIGGDVDGAVDRLTTMVERVPHPAAALLLAELQEWDGRPAEAADTAEVVRSLAALQAAQGQVVDLELALFEADRGEDTGHAVELARRAYRARPDNVFAADALAWALHRNGSSKAAQRYAEQALRLGTADAALYHHAAEVFAATGRAGDAREALRSAFALTPWFSFAALDDARLLAQRLDVAVPAQWPAA